MCEIDNMEIICGATNSCMYIHHLTSATLNRIINIHYSPRNINCTDGFLQLSPEIDRCTQTYNTLSTSNDAKGFISGPYIDESCLIFSQMGPL